MYHKLLVPLDGSELAERALPYAVRLAQAAQGRVILVRAALAPLPGTIDGAGWEQMQVEAIDDAARYLAEVAAKLATRVPLQTAVAYGSPTGIILDTARTSGADAIVMASHGRTGLPHLLHGSVAEAVLAESPVPVFLVHACPGEAAATAFEPSSARLLVPLDGSPFAEAALQPALNMLGTSGELTLVLIAELPDHVLRDENGRVLSYIDQQEQTRKIEARDYLTLVASRLRKQQPGAQISIEVRLGDPATGIIMVAAERVIDLVVMATHGRTGLRRAVVGSVAGDVLRTGSTPVLLVHPHATSSEAVKPGGGAPRPAVVA